MKSIIRVAVLFMKIRLKRTIFFNKEHEGSVILATSAITRSNCILCTGAWCLW